MSKILETKRKVWIPACWALTSSKMQRFGHELLSGIKLTIQNNVFIRETKKTNIWKSKKTKQTQIHSHFLITIKEKICTHSVLQICFSSIRVCISVSLSILPVSRGCCTRWLLAHRDPRCRPSSLPVFPRHSPLLLRPPWRLLESDTPPLSSAPRGHTAPNTEGQSGRSCWELLLSAANIRSFASVYVCYSQCGTS